MLSDCEQNDARNQKQQIKVFLGISLNHRRKLQYMLEINHSI